MRDVFVNSSTSAFVVGLNALLARWVGGQRVVDLPPPNSVTDNRLLTGVWSDGPSNAWAVGSHSTMYRFTGVTWSLVSDSVRPTAARDNYNAVWGSGSNVWAVADSVLLHVDGTRGRPCR